MNKYMMRCALNGVELYSLSDRIYIQEITEKPMLRTDTAPRAHYGLTASGFLERYFRPEGKMGDHVVALPIERTRMRLYCLRMSDSVLIVGNGGMKSTKTYEEDESLNGYVITLQRLDKLLGQAMKSGKVTIEETTITGIDKTEFEL